MYLSVSGSSRVPDNDEHLAVSHVGGLPKHFPSVLFSEDFIKESHLSNGYTFGSPYFGPMQESFCQVTDCCLLQPLQLAT